MGREHEPLSAIGASACLPVMRLPCGFVAQIATSFSSSHFERRIRLSFQSMRIQVYDVIARRIDRGEIRHLV